MSYYRIIPRDLFNEANLLKMLGHLYLYSETDPDVTVSFDGEDEDDKSAFIIAQNPADGSIFVSNVHVTMNGKDIHCFRPLNARSDWPLYAECGDKVERVFHESGEVTEAFLNMADDLN